MGFPTFKSLPLSLDIMVQGYLPTHQLQLIINVGSLCYVSVPHSRALYCTEYEGKNK